MTVSVSTATRVLFAVLTLSKVFAADPVFRLGTPTFFGSGCPNANSVQVATSPDNQIVSVALSQFAATTSSRATRDRKACNLVLPLTVMQGMSVAVFKVDYRGHAFVPSAASPVIPGTPGAPGAPAAPTAFANFQTEYFFAGVKGPVVDKSWFVGSGDSPIELSDSFQIGTQSWSPCGATSSFRINTAVTAVKARHSDEDVRIAVNATELSVSGGMRFYVTSQPCIPPTTTSAATTTPAGGSKDKSKDHENDKDKEKKNA